MTLVRADGWQRQPAGDDSGVAKSSEPVGRKRPPVIAASRPLTFAAYVADAHFFGDFCIALACPLVMLGFIARSLDPRVGAAAGATGADTAVKGLLCSATAASGALGNFPYGSSLGLQELHAARHLVWYAVLRPASQSDWAGLLLNGIHMACAGFLLLLAVSPRTSAVWAWWRRYRLAFVLTASLLSRCVLLLAAFLLVPPHAWPRHTWAAYVVSATSSPLAHALAMGVYNLLVKVPLPAALVQALAHTAAVFVLAYRVAPTVVTGKRQQHWGRVLPLANANRGGGGGPVPLQCGSPLRPEHSALLSCRPLALQVLLGLAMVAWPVGLSWAVERRLRRQHAAVCREWERRRGLQQGQQGDALGAPATAQQQSFPPCSEATHLDNPHRGRSKGAALDSACSVPGGPSPPMTPVAVQAVGPRPGTARAAGAPHRSARYRSRMTATMVTVKVQEHPGGFREYGSRLASVVRDCVREELRSTHTSSAAPSPQAAAPEPLLWTTVIRGCVQVLLWGCVPEGEEGAGAGGVGDPGLTEQLMRRLAVRLNQMMAEEGSGSVRGVSVQVGQEVAVLGDPSADVPLPEVLPLHGDSGGGGGGGGGDSVRLLQMSPPAASVPAVAASGSLTVRLLLHSPTPQPARVLVLAERQGAISSREEPRGGGLAPWRPTRARLLLELPVQLEVGVQQVEVVLRAGELARAGTGFGEEGAEGVAAAEGNNTLELLPAWARPHSSNSEPYPEDAVCALRVVMVGPVHQPLAEAGQREEAAGPPPLVHWVAPPLLLLPPAAAAEVCGAWEEMQREAGGGLAEAEQEGQRQEHGQLSGKEEQAEAGEGSAPHTGALSPFGFSDHLASAERRSSLWWSHMAPLLGDLAYAMGGQQGQGQERNGEAADPVWQVLLPYLQGQGMAETLFLLSRRDLGRTDQQGHRVRVSHGTKTSVPAAAAAAGAAEADLVPTTLLGATISSSDPTQPAGGSNQGAASHHRMGTHLAGRASYSFAALPFPSFLPRPFSPPALEIRYQHWRLERLAHMTPYTLLVFDVGVSLILMLRALAPLPDPAPVSGGGAGATPLSLLLRVAHISAFILLTTVADVLGLAVLYVRVVLRRRCILRRQQQQQRHERGRQGGAGGAASPGTTPAVYISPRDVVWYWLAACVAGPAALLLCGALTVLRVTPHDPRGVGNIRPVYGAGLVRSVIVPCLQQMSAWEAVAAAPLMGLGEALVLMHMQPTWGVWQAGAAAAVWRLVAVGVSAAWEWRSRGTFAQGQQREAGGAGAIGAPQRSGTGKGPGGSKKRV